MAAASSMATTAQGFGSLATQQQAKSMSQQYLDSKAGGEPTIYDTDVNYIKDLASFMGNKANQTYSERYEKQLKDAQYNQQQAASDKLSTDRTAFERQQALKQQDFNNQQSLSNSFGGSPSNGSRSSGGGGSNTFTSSVSSSNPLNDDITKYKVQSEGQMEMAELNYRNQVDMMNRQASLNAQTKANDFINQSKESAAERASRERQTAMDAQSRVYSSMFNSFNSGGNQNYQYWGGKV